MLFECLAVSNITINYLCCVFLPNAVPTENMMTMASTHFAETCTKTGSEEKKEFEEVLLAGSNCVFVNYDGTVIPW